MVSVPVCGWDDDGRSDLRDSGEGGSLELSLLLSSPVKIEIRHFRPKHIHQIVPREYEREVSRVTGRDWAHEFGKGRGYTLFADGVARGAGGIVPVWAGVGEVWLYVSAWLYTHPKTSYRWIREMLQTLIEEGGFYRVQCPILDTAPANKRLVRHLGFRAEGRMERWGPDGKTYCMYAIVADQGERVCLLRPSRRPL